MITGFEGSAGIAVDRPGTYEAQLTVSDGLLDSLAATVTITTENSPPVAHAGTGQTVVVGTTVSLDGSLSSDVDGDPLTYHWVLVTRPAGSTAVLDNAALVHPTFVVDRPGTYVAQLMVADSTVASAPATVTITTQNSRPVAHAGPAQTVLVGTTVQLDGSASNDVDGDALTFAWALTTTPAGSLAVLSNPTAVQPTFVLDLPGTYVVQLTVSDSLLASLPATVTITTQNSRPVADAGPDQTVAVGATVQLDGSASHDADGDGLTYQWSLSSIPPSSTAVLSNPFIVNPTFVIDQPTTYVAQLIVNDSQLASAPDTVRIDTQNSPPVAHAGPDQTVFFHDTVHLDGRGSSDVDGNPLSYRWSLTTRPAGSTATLSDTAAVQPTFVVDHPGTYVAQVMVNDGLVDSAPDTVTLTTMNRPPVLTPLVDQTVRLGSTLNLQLAATDPDGDALTFAVDPLPAHASLAATTGLFTFTPTADQAQLFTLTFSVSDGALSDAQTITTTVFLPPTLTTFQTTSGSAGASVMLIDTHLDTTTGVMFNGVMATFTIVSPTQVLATVPAGATNGPITLTTRGGRVTSMGYFVVIPTQNFTLAVTPDTATVIQSSTATYLVTASGTAGFAAPITLQATGLPEGVSASFAPPMISAGQSAMLTLTATAQAAPALVAFSITGTASVNATSVTQSTIATLMVVAQGGTNLVGRIVDTDGLPIPGVVVSVGAVTAMTDANGNFLLRNLPEGDHVLVMDGGPASTATRHYPLIPANVTLTAATTNTLPYAPQLHVQKNANFTPIDPTQDTIATDPDLPGVLLHIPAGVQIMGLDGQPNQMVSIRTVPIDRLPIKPLPPEVAARTVYMFYFGKQGGGMPTQPVPFTAPNDLGLDPGAQAELWYFDESTVPGEAPNDWRLAGLGTVSEDGRTIATDPGVGIPKFCCGAAVWGPRTPPPQQPGATPEGEPGGGDDPNKDHPKDGDPVDLSTGIFLLTATDLALPGRVPVAVTRTYRSGDPLPGPFGIGTTWVYDDFLQQTSATVLTYVYQGNARTQFFRQPDGSYRNATVPAFRGARILVNPDGTRMLLWKGGAAQVFDSRGLPIRRRDRNGNEVVIAREVETNPSTISEPSGRALRLTWVIAGRDRAASATDPLGRTVLYTYDAQNRLTAVTNPAGGVTSYTYDAQHRMTSITNPRGITFLQNSYDVNSRVCRQVMADGGTFAFYYVTADRATVPDSLQLLQEAATGGPVSMAPCTAQPTRGLVVATVVVDPLGHPTTYRFNGSGSLIARTNALGQTTQFERTPGNNLLLSSTDTLGRVTRYTYDANGNRTTITDLAGNVWALTYEATFNRVSTITDPLGRTTTFAYDASGNLTTSTDPAGNTTHLTYNPFGQPLSATDPLGNTTTFAYNSQGDVTTITDPLGNSVRRVYDPLSRLIAESDPRNKTTRFVYDALDRIVETVDALNGVTRFTYDANGNRLTVTDALSHTTTYGYDPMDRAIRRTDPVMADEVFVYDVTGNLISYTDRKAQTTHVTYDALNRRLEARYADHTATTYRYDMVGRLVQVSETAGDDIRNSYDLLDRLAQQTTEHGTLAYTYDVRGLRTSMQVAGQLPVTYSYDVNARLTQLTQGGQQVAYTYDALGRRTQLILPNGVITAYSYDAASRLTELVYRNATGMLGNLTYQYDPSGNRLAVGGSFARTALPAPVASASYDAANRQLTFGNNDDL